MIEWREQQGQGGSPALKLILGFFPEKLASGLERHGAATGVEQALRVSPDKRAGSELLWVFSGEQGREN